ncbi:hypothetical protein GCM10020254_59860 [Streptomyces goshikiensis]
MLGRMIVRWRAVREAARGPVITHALIAGCCVVFLIGPASGLNPSYGTGDRLLETGTAYFRQWGVVPQELFEGSPRALLTPLTALFVHGSWLHLLGNMLFLYVFGAMTEERMGRPEFLCFTICTGYLALAAYAAANASSDQTLVGASGAISAVLGGVPVPVPAGAGDEPVPLPALPPPPLPGVARTAVLVRPPVAGGAPRGERPRGGLPRPPGGLLAGLPLRVGAIPAYD